MIFTIILSLFPVIIQVFSYDFFTIKLIEKRKLILNSLFYFGV